MRFRPLNPIAAYTRWLHTRWPAGRVERLPEVGPDGTTALPGLYIAGDLTGVPLLKFAADSGARAVRAILTDPKFARRGDGAASGPDDALDLIIIGGGVAGMAAVLEAAKAGLRFEVLEAAEPFATIVNFPKAKPIYTYPTGMTSAGELRLTADVKEGLVRELRAQTVERGIEPRIARVERVRRRGAFLEVVLAGEGNEGREGRGPRAEGREKSEEGHVSARPLALSPRPSLPPLLAHRVLIAIGRSGDYRRLSVPGEDLDKVYNRLHDPKDFAGQEVLVVGGGDSALETAIAVAQAGGRVTLAHRGQAFNRPKAENVAKIRELGATDSGASPFRGRAQSSVSSGPSRAIEDTDDSGRRRPALSVAPDARPSLRVRLSTRVKEIRPDQAVLIDDAGREDAIPNDVVFTMLGREPPLDFLRRSGVRVRGDWGIGKVAALVLVLLACAFVYHWKKKDARIADVPVAEDVQRLGNTFEERGWFPYNVPGLIAARPDAGSGSASPSPLRRTLAVAVGEPSFYYSLAYSACVAWFGYRRVRRKPTPYIKLQTATLAAIQIVPLFLLPFLVLPWMGYHGLFDEGHWLAPLADALFPRAGYGYGREYWRAIGLVLAWPLFLWNVFTDQPMWTWLAISLVQTFVIIPGIVYVWGKGAYCGWICSCGALAETLGDAHRHKMPHGPGWNRLNMLGQAFLLFALVLLALRVAGWAWPGAWPARGFDYLFARMPVLNYAWFVDLLWAGILGVGLYWHFSGRVWCRFACPLAALMHVYARFSRFRILADKKKCISCNVCTTVCHQGIDVMSFANKGEPMADPQCVRCSACVVNCPTGVLSFGRVSPRSGEVTHVDRLGASFVQASEVRVNGRRAAPAGAKAGSN